jgi:acetyl esterase
VPVHPQAQMVLDFMADTGFTFEGLTADELRARANMAVPSPIELPSITDRTVPGPAGDIPVRIYRPSDETGLPVVVFFHGGGWVIGDLESHDHMARAIASKAECVVVAVDYRLAPEHKFPAAIDDAWTATRWVAAHAAELAIDASRLAVGGDSAGGTLAAVGAIHARDIGMPLVLQLLITPGTAAAPDTPSHQLYANGFLLEAAGIEWFFDHYIDRGHRLDWRFAPLMAADLDDVAPACVILAECDPLVDEGVAYADRLRMAGVPVELELVRGMTHDFIKMGRALKEASNAQQAAADALRKAWHEQAS